MDIVELISKRTSETLLTLSKSLISQPPRARTNSSFPWYLTPVQTKTWIACNPSQHVQQRPGLAAHYGAQPIKAVISIPIRRGFYSGKRSYTFLVRRISA